MSPGVQRVRERADTLLTRLKLADRHDKASTRRRNVWIFTAFGVAILGIVGTIVAHESGDVRRIIRPETLFFLVALPLVIVAIGQAIRYHRLDLDDRKLVLALRLVTMLRADTRAGAPVAMTADFRSYRRGGAVVERSGSWLGNNVRKYRHPWLTLQVALADGNVLTVSVVDRVTARQKRKSAGGKTKYRTRVRARSDVRLAVRLARRYRPAASVASRLPAGTVPGLTIAAVTPSTDGARLDALFRSPTVLDTSGLPGPGAVLGALRWLYGGLNAAARQTA
jgi:hypothetical protein